MQPTPAEWTRGAFTVTCDPARQDLDVIHGFLTACYWAKGIPRETVARSLAGALCFAIRHRAGDDDRQVGFAPLKRPDFFMERHDPQVYAPGPPRS